MNIPTRKAVIQSIKKRGKTVVGVYPIHYPRELFRAFGIHPVEIWGPPGIDTSSAKSHLQTYICSIVQSGLSFYLKDLLDYVDMVLVPHCCDSLQGLGSILMEFLNKDKPVFTMYMPRGKREEDIEFLEKEIKYLYEKLSSFTGIVPSKEGLLKAIKEEEEIDELVLKAYELQTKAKIGSFEFYKTLRLREYLPVSIYKEHLLELVNTEYNPSKDAISVLFSGVLPEPMEILRFVDGVGGIVVGDDFACLRRRVYPKGNSKEPFRRMAERIVNAPPDAMMGSSFKDRADFLISYAKATSAKGVVFYNVKFCEPEKFYHPVLKNRLEQSGIPSVVLEVDINEPLPQQIKTRMAAFIEMLQGV